MERAWNGWHPLREEVSPWQQKRFLSILLMVLPRRGYCQRKAGCLPVNLYEQVSLSVTWAPLSQTQNQLPASWHGLAFFFSIESELVMTLSSFSFLYYHKSLKGLISLSQRLEETGRGMEWDRSKQKGYHIRKIILPNLYSSYEA